MLSEGAEEGEDAQARLCPGGLVRQPAPPAPPPQQHPSAHPTAHPTAALAAAKLSSTPESQLTKGKMKQYWNVKCIIQPQPKRPTLPRGVLRLPSCQR